MFSKSAKLYDLVYRSHKDYKDEASKLDYLLKQLTPIPSRLLDVACGSGEHALQLNRQFGYVVDGVDVEPEFIAIAQAKNPTAQFFVSDMAEFNLNKTYDTVLCLFSSIGYVETIANLECALKSMAIHLKPEGYLILEPWLEPTTDLTHLNTTIDAHDPESSTSIRRTRIAHLEGKTSVLEINYEITEEKSTTHLRETHRLGMFSRTEMENAFYAAGFTSTYAEHGLHNKGLYLAKKIG